MPDCLPHLRPHAGPPAAANARRDCEQDEDLDLRLRACSSIIEGKAENDKPAAYNNRGGAYVLKGEIGRAIADFDRAIALNPEFADAYHNRGFVYREKGEAGRAIADYDRAIALNPKDAKAYNNRGIAYDDKGEYDRAIADYNRAIALKPKDAKAYSNRAGAYEAKGDFEKAAADRAKAVELDPKNAGTFTSLMTLGYAKFSIGDFKGASGDFQRALETKDDIYAMLFRYLARARAGETPVAAELEANAGRLQNKEWPYAVIELYLGTRSPELTLSAAVKPDQQCEAQFYSGEWHILGNRPGEAEALLRKAAEACPKDFIEYNAALAELKRLKP